GFSYVAQSVCEDFARDAVADTSSTSRRRHHGDRAALSAGRLRRLGGVPCLWSSKTDTHHRNGHSNHPGPIVHRTGLDPVTATNGILNKIQLHAHAVCTGHKTENGFVRPSTGTRLVKPEPPLLPSASQATLVGRNSDQEMDSEIPCNMAGPGVDELEEEENVPGAKQIQQSNGCSFYIPPHPPERSTTKDVVSFDFTAGPVNVDKSNAFQGYPIPLTHSASGNQLRIGRPTQGAGTITSIPQPAHRSTVDLKSYGYQNKSITGHLPGRFNHSTDHLGALHSGTGINRRPLATQQPVPSINAHKAPSLAASRTDVSPVSNGSHGINGVVGTNAAAGSISPHQNGASKCSVM
ncbi:unnamed protein product, partial [Echinostoma caproni]|uniref:NYAP_N domain-containing protein n=1 Tax=Echinostoma caproni TaxID=27848 RepID=A0A183AZB9_9TREM